MTSREAKRLGIPLSALNPPIPDGWKKVKQGNVQDGDRIHFPDGWDEAGEAISMDSKFFTCVIRKAIHLKPR